MTDVKVEQCDVDLAARIAKDFGFDVSHSDWLAPKLARHRQAAEKAQQERDAGICDMMKVEFADADNAGNDEAEEAWHGGMALAASRIATAIRSQGHE